MSVSDNCGFTGLITTNDFNNDFTLIDAVLPLGDTVVTWTSTDSSGNTASCSVTITVVDNEDPIVTCPADITQNADLGCGSRVNFTPTATDNCGVASIVSVPASGEIFPVGTTTVTVTATDDAGNTDVCTFTVTVVDNTPPQLTCAPAALRNTDPGVCEYTVQGSEFDASAGDPCGIDPTTFINNFTGTNTLAGAALPLGSTIIEWTATDNNGNTSTCTTQVIVLDNQDPVVTCPADITQDADLGCGSRVNFTPTATDNCGVASIVSVPASGEIFPVGTTTVTVTATDDAGNTDVCTFTVTVVDNTPPQLTCAPAALRNTDPGVCEYTVQGSEFDASAGDPCGIDPTTFINNFTGTNTLAGAALPLGSTIIEWTATDNNGNTSTCTTQVIVLDNQDPVVTCPANITQDTDLGLCGATVTFAPTATDNCGVASIVSVPASGSFFP